MNQRIGKLVITGLSAALLVGCAATYKPSASDTQLASYAGAAVYPREITAVQAPHLFCSIAPDATITIYNAGDESYSNFEIWINQMYTLHIEKLDARSTIAIDPATVYNKSGSNLKGVPAASINAVQVFMQDKLWDVQGPILPH